MPARIDELLKLTPLEQDYYELFQQHPEIEHHEPQTLAQLTRQLESIPAYPELFARHFGTSTPLKAPQEKLPEKLFARQYDVEVRQQERYVPGYLHQHEYFEIIYLLHGETRIMRQHDCLPLKAGDVCITPPGLEHEIPLCRQDTLVLYLIVRSSTFASTFFGTLAEEEGLARFFSTALHGKGKTNWLRIPTGGDETLCTLALTMWQEFRHQERYSALMLNSLMTSFFILLLRRYAEQAVFSPDSNIPANIVQLLHYMNDHSAKLTLCQLAAEFSYSERQLSRLLKEHTGSNFTELLQDIRMKKGARLLEKTQAPISEIIAACGYSNANHFYKLFHERYGMTPQSYRQQL